MNVFALTQQTLLYFARMKLLYNVRNSALYSSNTTVVTLQMYQAVLQKHVLNNLVGKYKLTYCLLGISPKKPATIAYPSK